MADSTVSLPAVTELTKRACTAFQNLAASDRTDVNSAQLACSLKDVETLLQTALSTDALSVCSQHQAAQLFMASLKMFRKTMERAEQLINMVQALQSKGFYTRLEKACRARKTAEEFASVSRDIQGSLGLMLNALQKAGLVEQAASATALKQNLHDAEFPPCRQDFELLRELESKFDTRSGLTPAEAALEIKHLLGPATEKDVLNLEHAVLRAAGSALHTLMKQMHQVAMALSITEDRLAEPAVADSTVTVEVTEHQQHQQHELKAEVVLNLPAAQQSAIHSLVEQLGSSSPSVQEQAAGVLCKMASNNAIRTAIAHTGAVPRLAALLKSQDLAVQAQAAGALESLALSHEENQVAIAQAGAIPALITLLSCPETHVHSNAAGALLALAADIDNEYTIVEAGAIEPLLALVSSRHSSETVLVQAAGALACLAADDVDHQQAMLDAGAVEALLPLAKGNNPVLQQLAVNILDSLTHDNEDKGLVQLMQAGLIPLLVRMLGGDRLPEGRAPALRLLLRFSNHQHVRRVVQEWGMGVACLVEVMSYGRRKEQAMAVEALVSLSALRIHRDHMVDSGCVPTLVRLLSSKRSEEVQLYATVLLRNLSTMDETEDTAHRRAVAKAGALPHLKRMQKSSNPNIRKAAASAIMALKGVEVVWWRRLMPCAT